MWQCVFLSQGHHVYIERSISPVQKGWPKCVSSTTTKPHRHIFTYFTHIRTSLPHVCTHVHTFTHLYMHLHTLTHTQHIHTLTHFVHHPNDTPQHPCIELSEPVEKGVDQLCHHCTKLTVSHMFWPCLISSQKFPQAVAASRSPTQYWCI